MIVINFENLKDTMGNVHVEYKQRRDGNEPGTKVENPKDFLQRLFGDQDSWNVSKALFDQMPADKKSEFLSAFDGEAVMDHHVTAASWIALNEDDDDALEAAAAILVLVHWYFPVTFKM